MKYRDSQLVSDDAETLAVVEVRVAFDYMTWKNKWKENQEIKGLLIAGKGAARAEGVTMEGVKQLDIKFETPQHVNLNLATNRLEPPFQEFQPEGETGFYKSVVELLTHTNRKNSKTKRSS